MTNSTVPAEAMGSPLPVSASYRWEAPSKAISVQLSLDLVDRLEREVIDAFKAVTKRGSEVGGVLLGRVAQGVKRTVFVEGFEPISCDYSRGPLYLLSDVDKDRLRESLQRLKSGSQGIVGFFRSNTRKDLLIDEEDLALYQEFFPDPNCVFLLVKPFAMKPSAAGFHIWEDGRIQPESYLQFPFRRSELLKGFPELIVEAGGSVSDAPPAVVVREDRAPVMFGRREERSTLGPTPVLKREESRPGPVIVPSKREEPVVTPPVQERSPIPPVSFKREDRPPALPPLPKREERAATPPVTPKREERPPVSPLSFRREERTAPTPPPPPRIQEQPPIVAKREEPPAAPPAPKEQPPLTMRREERPPILPRREERPPVQPVVAKREERPPLTSKPAITPIAPKLEEPPKREERPAPPPIVAKREEPAPARTEKREERVVTAPSPKTEAVVASPKPEPTPARFEPVPAVSETAAPTFEVETSSAPGRSKKWLLIGLAAVLVLGSAGYYQFVVRGQQGIKTEETLGLRVDRAGGQIQLSWKKDAAIVANASRAVLSITDGEYKEDVPLDAAQLRTGYLVYSPITNDVSFRLEASDAKSGKNVSESLRALAPPASATGKPAGDVKLPAAVSGPASTPTETAQVTQPVEQPVAEPAKTVAAKPFVARQLASRITQPDAPPAPIDFSTSAAPVSGRSVPIGSGGVITAPPPPVPQANTQGQPAPSTSSPAQPVVTGGRAVAPVVVRRVQPAYPPIALRARIQGTVTVDAVVGRDGKVKKATPVSGQPLLRQAAADAVLKWTYRPGTLNGEATEVPIRVDVNFTLDR